MLIFKLFMIHQTQRHGEEKKSRSRWRAAECKCSEERVCEKVKRHVGEKKREKCINGSAVRENASEVACITPIIRSVSVNFEIFSTNPSPSDCIHCNPIFVTRNPKNRLKPPKCMRALSGLSDSDRVTTRCPPLHDTMDISEYHLG